MKPFTGFDLLARCGKPCDRRLAAGLLRLAANAQLLVFPSRQRLALGHAVE